MSANGERVTCPVCPHACSLGEGQLGICRARVARNSRVIDENYGRITSLALDPIEKKPLARFMPGSSVLSIGSYGCNMRCAFCQNASIAQVCGTNVPWDYRDPETIADMAAAFAPQGNVASPTPTTSRWWAMSSCAIVRERFTNEAWSTCSSRMAR